MTYRLLLLLSLYVLFTNFSCEEECFPRSAAITSLELDVIRENNEYVFDVGDTLWVNADFAATSPGGQLMITEGGGIVITHVSRRDSLMGIIGGRADIGSVATQGDLQPTTVSQDNTAYVVRFFCPGGRCGYRQGFVPRRPGDYLLLIRGGQVDAINQDFQFCTDISFTNTVLNGEDHLDRWPEEASNAGDNPFSIGLRGASIAFTVR